MAPVAEEVKVEIAESSLAAGLVALPRRRFAEQDRKTLVAVLAGLDAGRVDRTVEQLERQLLGSGPYLLCLPARLAPCGRMLVVLENGHLLAVLLERDAQWWRAMIPQQWLVGAGGHQHALRIQTVLDWYARPASSPPMRPLDPARDRPLLLSTLRYPLLSWLEQAEDWRRRGLPAEAIDALLVTLILPRLRGAWESAQSLYETLFGFTDDGREDFDALFQRLRNRIQVVRQFPGLHTTLFPGPQARRRARETAARLLDQIDQGHALFDRLRAELQLPRWLIRRLAAGHPWPPQVPARLLMQIGRMHPDAAPDDAASWTRTCALAEQPEVRPALRQAVASRQTSALREWIHGEVADELDAYLEFLRELLAHPSLRGRLDPRRAWCWMGYPGLAQLGQMQQAWQQIESGHAQVRRTVRPAADPRVIASDRWPALCGGPIQLGAYSFVCLNSAEAVTREGQRMRHCVAELVIDCQEEGASIFSIQRDGQPVATLALMPDPSDPAWQRLIDLKGPCNREVPPEVSRAAQRFIAELSDQPRRLSAAYLQHWRARFAAAHRWTEVFYRDSAIETFAWSFRHSPERTLERYRPALEAPGGRGILVGTLALFFNPAVTCAR